MARSLVCANCLYEEFPEVDEDGMCERNFDTCQFCEELLCMDCFVDHVNICGKRVA